MSGRVIGRVSDYQIAELGPSRNATVDSIITEARRRFPFCDLGLRRNESEACYEVTASGYIEGEVVQKRDSLPCPQA